MRKAHKLVGVGEIFQMLLITTYPLVGMSELVYCSSLSPTLTLAPSNRVTCGQSSAELR
jgi:hypothetical protein